MWWIDSEWYATLGPFDTEDDAWSYVEEHKISDAEVFYDETDTYNYN